MKIFVLFVIGVLFTNIFHGERIPLELGYTTHFASNHMHSEMVLGKKADELPFRRKLSWIIGSVGSMFACTPLHWDGQASKLKIAQTPQSGKRELYWLPWETG